MRSDLLKRGHGLRTVPVAVRSALSKFCSGLIISAGFAFMVFLAPILPKISVLSEVERDNHHLIISQDAKRFHRFKKNLLRLHGSLHPGKIPLVVLLRQSIQ